LRRLLLKELEGWVDKRIAIDLGAVLVDVEVFLHEASIGLLLGADPSGDEAPDWLAQAESTYAGDLLEDDPYGDWAVPLREEARATYIEVAHKLARRGEDSPWRPSLSMWTPSPGCFGGGQIRGLGKAVETFEFQGVTGPDENGCFHPFGEATITLADGRGELVTSRRTPTAVQGTRAMRQDTRARRARAALSSSCSPVPR
jgi:hypothetical protein